VPFVRFSRDKRGYEYIYLFQEPTGKGGGSRPRVLYWYRTPPGVKVGREPFDSQVRQALEAENPNVNFDWKSIMQAQPPPIPEAEPWRERRRAERSAKQSRTAARLAEPPEAPEAEAPAEEAPTSSSPAEESAVSSPAVGPVSPLAPRGRRRRRGGRRRNRGAREPLQGSALSAPAEGPAQTEPSVAAKGESDRPGSENPDDETEAPEGTS
jgi:hypothetical protein